MSQKSKNELKQTTWRLRLPWIHNEFTMNSHFIFQRFLFMILVILLLFCFVIENSRNLLSFLSFSFAFVCSLKFTTAKLILFLRSYFQIECKIAAILWLYSIAQETNVYSRISSKWNETWNKSALTMLFTVNCLCCSFYLYFIYYYFRYRFEVSLLPSFRGKLWERH